MTAAEPRPQTIPLDVVAPERSSWRPWLAFGAGVAIEIAGDTLEVSILRARPHGPELLGRGAIRGFRERPANEISAEFRTIVQGHKPAGVVVLLPRREVIVRQVPFPGVRKRDIESALALRLRALHPFAEDDAAWCWTPVPGGALVGLMRLSSLGRYESLFADAGIPVASFTFSATVLHSALRIYGKPGTPLLGLTESAASTFEVYGENAAGAIFSGEFPGPADRAASFAVSELRLPSGAEAMGLGRMLPAPRSLDDSTVIERPLLYAGALAAACPWLAGHANFLPPERRAGQSRLWLVPTGVLAFLLICSVAAISLSGPWRERRYLQALHQEINKVEPGAHRSAALDKQIGHTREQIAQLDHFRGRSLADFEVLNELTRLLPAPAWANQVEIFADSVVIAGEAEQAAPLLKVLDNSPLFHNSDFVTLTRSGKSELFRIKTFRRPRP